MSEVADIAEPLTASQMLKTAREAAGLSQDQVAQELYLTPSYIRLIDSDEVEKIAKQAFVRGYLRSYAKLVQLSGDEVVARFDQTHGGGQPKVEMRRVTKESIGSTNFTGPVFQTGILGLVGLIAVVILVWYLTTSEEEAPVTVGPAVSQLSESARQRNALAADVEAFESAPEFEVTPGVKVSGFPEETESSEEPAVEPATSNVAPIIVDAANATPAARPASQIVKAEVAQADQSISEPQVSNTLLAAANPAPVFEEAETLEGRDIAIQRVGNLISVVAGGDDELRFFFSDECWIEIEDSAGDSIYGDLNRAGDELVVSGSAPFEVLFGKAPAVTMEYNGVPIDLVPHTTSVDTAKLKVGS